jgi:hypothetical protein
MWVNSREARESAAMKKPGSNSKRQAASRLFRQRSVAGQVTERRTPILRRSGSEGAGQHHGQVRRGRRCAHIPSAATGCWEATSFVNAGDIVGVARFGATRRSHSSIPPSVITARNRRPSLITHADTAPPLGRRGRASRQSPTLRASANGPTGADSRRSISTCRVRDCSRHAR